MKRSSYYFRIFLGILSIWTGLKIGVKTEEFPNARQIVDYFPLLAVAAFALACAGKLGFDISTFNNYPQEIGKLEQDIIGARSDLKKRGFPADGVSAKHR